MGNLCALVISLTSPTFAVQAFPENDEWTEVLSGSTWRWSFYHEDKNKELCKPVTGETILLDYKVRTSGAASVSFRYPSSEVIMIRRDIPLRIPRQIYNVLRLSEPVDISNYDALEFDIASSPEGSVCEIRVLIELRARQGKNPLLSSGSLPFACGKEWKRFGIYMSRMRELRTGKESQELLTTAKCQRLLIDVRIPESALRKSEYIEVWIDGLKFVSGKSEPAEAIASPVKEGGAVNPFADACVLDWEDLGVMVRGRTTLRGSPVVGFSTDKNGWSAYAGYRDHIIQRKPWLIVEINLQTGKVKHFQGPSEETSDTWRFRVFPDGRPYTLPGGGHEEGARIARIDWKTGQLQIFGPCPDPWNYCWNWGAGDRAIYIGGYRKGYAIRFDPETGEITNYGTQGPPDAVHIITIAADDSYLYTTVGKDYSYLIACEKKTRKQKILSKVRWPERWTLNTWSGQVFARLHPPVYVNGQPRWKEFRLWHCELEPIPERPPRPPSRLPDKAFGVPRPKLLRGSAMCLGDGYATLWYRFPDEDWRSIRYRVDDVPSYLFRIATTLDGKIIGSSEDPYTVFLYDPKTGEKELIGPPPNMTHIYSFLSHPNGKVYMCGYSGAPLFAWDSDKPWTYQPSTPDRPIPKPRDPNLNPKQVARMYRQRRAFKIVLAGDERLYIPCSAYVERIPGGGLGWYDPEKNEAGLIREGFETWRGNDACSALDGRYVVVTTVPWPEGRDEEKVVLTDPHDLIPTEQVFRLRYRGPKGATGERLTSNRELEQLLAGRKKRVVNFDQRNYAVVFDTKTRRVVAKLPLGEGHNLDGRLCEWKAGKVIVRVRSRRGAKYGLLDLTYLRFKFELEIPGSPYGNLLRLPDGMIASIQQGVIIAIEPTKWKWKVVGRLRPLEPGKQLVPRDWTVLGADLYLFCDTHLARIKDISRAITR